MPHPDRHPSWHKPQNPPIEDDPSVDFDRWFANLQDSDQKSYNLMAMDVWSIAKTMDNLFPGFWNRFMMNRRLASQQFHQQYRSSHRKETDGFPNP